MTKAGQKYWARRHPIRDKLRHPRDVMKLPRIPSIHEYGPFTLMPMARADALLYKMHKLAFQRCQDFRG